MEYPQRIQYEGIKTTRYTRLPDNGEIVSMSNVEVDRGLACDRWTYGDDFAKPNGEMPKRYGSNIIVDDTIYAIPRDIYRAPTTNTIKRYRENEFNPPINTPEQAKVYQGPQTLFNR